MFTSGLFHRLFRWLSVLALIPLLGLSSGCVLVAVGAAAAGSVAYVRGELSTTLDHKLETSAQAAERALEQLKFVKVSQKQDALVALLIARTVEDKKIEIRLSATTEASTKVQIRVGVFGDEALSLKILERIKANL